MIKEIKALRFHDPFDCRLDTMKLDPPKDTEMQCKAIYSLISIGTEIISWRRQFDASMHRVSELGQPYNFGYNMVARVMETGKNVEGYKAGDIVFAHMKHNQYFNIEPSVLVTKIPEGISAEEACWTTVLKLGMFACMKAEIKPTDAVVIMGLGVFGISALQYARVSGAKTIIAIDPRKQRADRAIRAGATHVINAKAENAIEEVVKLCNGRKADSVIDATEKAEGLAIACELTKSNGRVLLISDPAEHDSQRVGTNVLKSYLNIHGISIGMMNRETNAFYPKTLPDVYDAIYRNIRSGLIDVKSLITHKVSPADAQNVYQAMYKDRSDYLGVLYDWSLISG